MSSPSERQPAPGVLERVLGLITEVRPGESAGALLLTLNVFLLLAAYYVMKPVREGLILELKGGAELKSWMSAAMTVLLIFLVPAYSAFANKVKRNRLVVTVTLFFASHLLLFWLGSSSAWIRERMGLVFFVWIGIFSMMAVAQFWAFSNDQYTEEQGKRLFALVGLGASLGSVIGSKLSGLLLPAIGLYPNLLVAGGMLVVCAGLTQLAYVANRKTREAAEAAVAAKHDAEASSGGEKARKADARGGFSLVFSSRYLTLIAFFSLAFSMANTNGEYILGSLFSDSAKALAKAGEIPADQVGRHIGTLYADFFFWVNLIGVSLQAFVVSRLVKYGGVKAALLTVPFIALTSGIAIALFPVLTVVRWGKTAENSADYSINNTARQLLWLPTSADVKYKAKQAVDTFFVRSGDVLSLLLVLLTTHVSLLPESIASPTRTFAICNLFVVVLWLVLALAIVRESKKLHGAAQDPEQAPTRDAAG